MRTTNSVSEVKKRILAEQWPEGHTPVENVTKRDSAWIQRDLRCGCKRGSSEMMPDSKVRGASMAEDAHLGSRFQYSGKVEASGCPHAGNNTSRVLEVLRIRVFIGGREMQDSAAMREYKASFIANGATPVHVASAWNSLLRQRHAANYLSQSAWSHCERRAPLSHRFDGGIRNSYPAVEVVEDLELFGYRCREGG